MNRKKRKAIATFIGLIFILIIGFIFIKDDDEPITGNIIKEENQDIQVYFCPADDCAQVLVDTMMSAESELLCAFFDLDLEQVRSALINRSLEDVDSKLVLDSDNADFIKGSGVRLDNKSSYMHNKFCIIDKKIVTTGSFNPTHRGAYSNNNNLIIINSKDLAKNYRDEFFELWDKESQTPTSDPKVDNMKSYFCPEDKCSEKIQDEIRAAKESIYFMTFSFTHEEIANDLITQKLNGLEIKGIFEKSQNSKYSQKERLDDHGIYTQFDLNKANMHHKVFIIDKETVITGSFNPSNNADKRNDENILIIKDKNIADLYMKEFLALS